MYFYYIVDPQKSTISLFFGRPGGPQRAPRCSGSSGGETQPGLLMYDDALNDLPVPGNPADEINS
jgi:hypothetical protein